MEQKLNEMLIKSERACYLTLGMIIGLVISSGVFSVIYLMHYNV